MFDLDLGKMLLFGVVALVVVNPRDLPAALRVAGRVYAQFRRMQGDIRKAADTLMADASLDRELATMRDAARIDLALNPATAMRGRLSAPAATVAEAEALEYITPEMQAYLAPLPEAAERLEATQEAS